MTCSVSCLYFICLNSRLFCSSPILLHSGSQCSIQHHGGSCHFPSDSFDFHPACTCYRCFTVHLCSHLSDWECCWNQSQKTTFEWDWQHNFVKVNYGWCVIKLDANSNLNTSRMVASVKTDHTEIVISSHRFNRTWAPAYVFSSPYKNSRIR